MAIVDKGELSKGFWLAAGVVLLLFVWGFVSGKLGSFAHG